MIHIGMVGPTYLPWAELYVAGSGTILSRDAVAYARDFATRLGVAHAEIKFRSDPWFIVGVPFLPFFDAGNSPLSKEEFNRTRTHYCYYHGPNSKCSWAGPVTLP